jgi:tetratricopeptide (TPR) repeat protein
VLEGCLLMKRAGHFAIIAVAGFCLASVALPASADTVTLTDGNTYHGKVIEQTDQHVLMLIEQNGMSARWKFERAKIARLEISPPADEQLDRLYQQKLNEAEEADTGEAFAELGQWLQTNKRYDQAIRIYQQAIRMAVEDAADVELRIAQCMAARGELREAQSRLKELADQFKDHQGIAAELARLDELAQKRVSEVIALAVDNFKKGQMRRAALVIERLYELNVDEMLARADYASLNQTGITFAKLLAEARLHQPCASCAGSAQLGLQPCPTCKGSGKITKTKLEIVEDRDEKGRVVRRRTRQVEYEVKCPTCGGFTTIVCTDCKGAGVDLGNVGEVEREEVVHGLVERIELLNKRLGQYLAEPGSLHPVNLEVVHLQATRMDYYVDQYIKLNPQLKADQLRSAVRRRNAVRNLVRHTRHAYAHRDLAKFEAILAKRLELLIKRDGILWPEDFQFKPPSELSDKGSSPAPSAP